VHTSVYACVCAPPPQSHYSSLFFYYSLLIHYSPRWLQSCLLVRAADAAVALLPIDDSRVMGGSQCDVYTRMFVTHVYVVFYRLEKCNYRHYYYTLLTTSLARESPVINWGRYNSAIWQHKSHTIDA